MSQNQPEAWANQFFRGQTDERASPQVGAALAALNCRPFDPFINEGRRKSMIRSFQKVEEHLLGLADKKGSMSTGLFSYSREICAADQNDRLVKLVVESLGVSGCREITENLRQNLQSRDCLVHGDAGASSILVEPMDKDNCLFVKKQFCFEEFRAFAGPVGFDFGLTLAWPLACLVSHASEGRGEAVQSILKSVNRFQKAYCQAMQHARDVEFARKALFNGLAYCGWYLYRLFQLESNTKTLPITTASQRRTVQESIGVLALKLMQWGLANKDTQYLNGEDLWDKVDEAIQDEIDNLMWTAMSTKMGHRPSSASGSISEPLMQGSIFLGLWVIPIAAFLMSDYWVQNI